MSKIILIEPVGIETSDLYAGCRKAKKILIEPVGIETSKFGKG